MRFHVLALPHTVTSKAYSACAFTQKVLKFCAMMTSRGHTVYHYGHERSEAICTEHITVTDDATLEQAYGAHDWHANSFKHHTQDHAHVMFNQRAAEAVGRFKQRGDFLLLFWGAGHAHVGRVHASDMVVVEPGIGSHNDIVAPFCVFESYAVMHHVYAKYNHMPRFFDAVVPNYFDPADFIDASGPPDERQDAIQRYLALNTSEPSEKSLNLSQALKAPDQGYVLVIARLIPTKGIQLAIEACEAAGIKLVIAGQGAITEAVKADLKYSATALDEPGGVTHVGYVEPRERAVLIARAKALLAPTLYSEPFAGVNVEAQMSGVPVVTTDWGAFTETVLHGITGYRCRTMEQFTWALKNVDGLNRNQIKQWAISNYGLNKVGSMYEEYFSMLSSVFHGRGFYDQKPGRLGLKWLEKSWPVAPTEPNHFAAAGPVGPEGPQTAVAAAPGP